MPESLTCSEAVLAATFSQTVQEFVIGSVLIFPGSKSAFSNL